MRSRIVVAMLQALLALVPVTPPLAPAQPAAKVPRSSLPRAFLARADEVLQ